MIGELEHHADAGQYGRLSFKARRDTRALTIAATTVTGLRVAEVTLTEDHAPGVLGVDALWYALGRIAAGEARPDDEVTIGSPGGTHVSIAAYSPGVGYPPRTARLRFNGAGGKQHWCGPLLADDALLARDVIDKLRRILAETPNERTPGNGSD